MTVRRSLLFAVFIVTGSWLADGQDIVAGSSLADGQDIVAGSSLAGGQEDYYFVYYNTSAECDPNGPVPGSRGCGPKYWDKVKYEMYSKTEYDWSLPEKSDVDYTLNMCEDRPRSGFYEDDGLQSPKLLKSDRKCNDRHEMYAWNLNCEYGQMDYIVTPHSVRAIYGNCSNSTDPNFPEVPLPTLDYSRSTALWYQNYIEVKVPAEHQIERNGTILTFDAELMMAHIGTAGAKDQLSHVNILYEVGDDGDCDLQLARLLYNWQKSMVKTYKECGLGGYEWQEDLCHLRTCLNGERHTPMPTNSPSSRPSISPTRSYMPSNLPSSSPSTPNPTSVPSTFPTSIPSPLPSSEPTPVPKCSSRYPLWLGDGHCDIIGGYNTPECFFDGGDCCPDTCDDSTSPYTCQESKMDCQNPQSKFFTGGKISSEVDIEPTGPPTTNSRLLYEDLPQEITSLKNANKKVDTHETSDQLNAVKGDLRMAKTKKGKNSFNEKRSNQRRQQVIDSIEPTNAYQVEVDDNEIINFDEADVGNDAELTVLDPTKAPSSVTLTRAPTTPPPTMIDSKAPSQNQEIDFETTQASPALVSNSEEPVVESPILSTSDMISDNLSNAVDGDWRGSKCSIKDRSKDYSRYQYRRVAPDDDMRVRPFDLLDSGTDWYYKYEGSQTYPPCNTLTNYHVMHEPRKICPFQLDLLERMIAGYLKRGADGRCKMATVGELRKDGTCKVNTNRPLQYHKTRDDFVKMQECLAWVSDKDV